MSYMTNIYSKVAGFIETDNVVDLEESGYKVYSTYDEIMTIYVNHDKVFKYCAIIEQTDHSETVFFTCLGDYLHFMLEYFGVMVRSYAVRIGGVL